MGKKYNPHPEHLYRAHSKKTRFPTNHSAIFLPVHQTTEFRPKKRVFRPITALYFSPYLKPRSVAKKMRFPTNHSAIFLPVHQTTECRQTTV
jgi:hypothetical protein